MSSLTTLRLLVTKECNRSCVGCVNEDWDLDSLPIVTDFTDYDEIILTGGEPMLERMLVRDVIGRIREQDSSVPIYMYTAMANLDTAILLNLYLDGITLTFHTQKDVEAFKQVKHALESPPNKGRKSLRLNVFQGIDISSLDLSWWKVKDGIEWIEDCPLPENEIFGRI